MLENINKENKNVNHVSFKECFPNGWREYFQKEDVILKIVEAAGLNRDHDFVKVNSKYFIDENRIAIILLLRRKGTEILDKVIIDTISGYPSFEQIMDVFYNIGSDCDYRVVLYDNNAKNDNYDYHPVIGSMLVSLMDELGNYTISLTVMGIDFNLNETNSINFQCLDVESINKDDKKSKLPERRMFEEAEFWGPYFLPAHRSYGSCNEYDFGQCGYVEDGADSMSSNANWDNDGMYVIYEINEEDLAWLLTNKTEEMKHIFEGCSIEYSREDRLIVKKDISLQDIIRALPEEKNYLIRKRKITICRPIPFRNFIYSLPEEKEALAEKFAAYATSIMYFEDLLRDRDNIISK